LRTKVPDLISYDLSGLAAYGAHARAFRIVAPSPLPLPTSAVFQVPYEHVPSFVWPSLASRPLARARHRIPAQYLPSQCMNCLLEAVNRPLDWRILNHLYIPRVPVMVSTRTHHPTMRDLEQELGNTLAQRYANNADGLHVLTRRMDNEEEEQFDVDLTILDFLVYKATGLVFQWKSSPGKNSNIPRDGNHQLTLNSHLKMCFILIYRKLWSL
jgi:hypothetical protein